MKLFWKLLAGMLLIIILSFSVFGTVLLQSSLQSSLDKETQSGMKEVRMLQYAFLAAVEGLEETYTVDERTMKQLAESVTANVGDSRNQVGVYNAYGQSIYPAGQRIGELYELLKDAESETAQGNCVWRLTEEGGTHTMEAMARMECVGQTYYLQVNRDIQSIYDTWESGYWNYRVTLLAIAALAAVLSALFAAGFTAPIRKLSLATRAFSKGVYERRVKVRGNDEVAALMQDFNGMADQLENNIHELKENARRQEEFTGAFAHELKTPLTSIIGYAEMLMTMDMDEEDRRRCADYIYREGRRLEQLSFKMLELIRIGKLSAEMNELQTAQVEAELRELVSMRLAKKNLHLHIELEEGVIRGDMDLLLSLLGNLVDNSRKACDEGGSIWVRGSVWHGLPEEANGYQIQVEDNGRGMPEEELDKITEAFYMIDKSRSRKEGGAGLGMAICGRIVEAFDADWEIASAPGEGTCVTLYFKNAPSRYESLIRGEI